MIDAINGIENRLSRAAITDISLLDGTLGISIFNYNLFRFTGDDRYLDKCQVLAEQVIDRFAHVGIDQTMRSGYTGIAWGLGYLSSKKVMDFDEDYLFSGVDMQIYIQSLRSLMNRNYDQLNGALGATLHALRRLPDDKAFGYLRQFVGAAKGLGIAEEFSIRWKNTGALLPHGSQEMISCALDLVHTMINIVSAFVNIYARGLFKEEISGLVYGYMDWIMGHGLVWLKDGGPEPGMLNAAGAVKTLWVAWGFFKAGRCFENEAWKQEGIRMLNWSIVSSRPFGKENTNLSLSKGACGVAYMYNKFYKETGDWDYRLTCEHSITDILKEGLVDSMEMRVDGYGLLTGWTGVGMVLLACLDNSSQDWDECLMVSTPQFS